MPRKPNLNMIKSTLLLAIAFLLTLAIEAQENCINNYTFQQYGKQKRSCSWIRASETRRRKNCLDIDVMNNCPQSCGACCEDDAMYTLTASNGEQCNTMQYNAINISKYRH